MAYTECYKLTPWTCVGSNIHQKANRHQSAKLLHVPSIASRDMYMGVMHLEVRLHAHGIVYSTHMHLITKHDLDSMAR